MRSAALSAAFLLAACAAEQPGAAAERIDCRPQGAAEFAPACSLDIFDDAQGRILTLRKADGGFRRLRIAADGSVAAADGAERAQVANLPDGGIEVEIGGDRFRLPARAR